LLHFPIGEEGANIKAFRFSGSQGFLFVMVGYAPTEMGSILWIQTWSGQSTRHCSALTIQQPITKQYSSLGAFVSQFSTDNAVAKAQHKATVQTLNKHINVDNDLECLEQFVDSLFVSLLSFLS
jgi:hypothetical protein